jgi:hypothetical protein
MSTRTRVWHRTHILALFLAGASLAACADADRPPPPGIPGLGISELAVTETATALRIAGVDATGATVAQLELKVGAIEVPDFSEPPLGRLLELRVGAADYRFPSAGLGDLYLPAPPEPALNQFFLAPAVARILARWGIVFADRDQWMSTNHPGPRAQAAEAEYASVCYDPYGLGGGSCSDSAAGCADFVAPCGTAGARSTCTDFAFYQGSADFWTQIVQCNNNVRADRICTWPHSSTSCGATGDHGCVQCGSTWQGPSNGQAVCSGTCGWYDGTTPPQCTASGNSCSSNSECCSNSCRTDYGMCVEAGWGCCNGTCGSGINEC